MSVSATRPTTRNLSELVSHVFTAWRAAAIDFLVLRNYEKLPQETGNDIDVLVRPEQFAHAEQVLVQAAQEVGYHLHNRAEFSPVSYFFHHPGSLQQIQFDLFIDLKWRGFVLLPPAPAFQLKIDRGLFFIPHPAHEAVTSLLTRLIYQGYVKENYKPAILAGFTRHPTETTAQLARVFGTSRAAAVFGAVQSEDWPRIESMCGGLRRALMWRQMVRHPWSTLGALLGDLRRLIRRFFVLPGITVVLTGADGCGKSTVAEKLVTGLRGTFHENKSRRVHWKPAVFLRQRRADRLPTTDPHAQPPRGPLASLVMLAYHWTEFFAGYWLQLRRNLFRNGLVLVDRYHYDFMVDPRRFRLAGAPRLTRLLFRLLPAPDLVFLLAAPPEVLQSRKQEVPVAETKRQCEAYQAVVSALPQGQIMDATKPPDEVAANVLRRVLEFMTARQKRRNPSP